MKLQIYIILFFYSILKTNVKINCIHLTNSLISYIYIYQSILINYLVYYNICIFTCLLTCLFIVTSLNYYYSGLPNNLYRHIRSFIPFPILQFQFVKLFSINRRLNKHELYDHEQVNNCTIGFSSVIISNPRSFRAQRQKERERGEWAQLESRYTARNRHHLPRGRRAHRHGVKIREGFGSRRLRGFRIP